MSRASAEHTPEITDHIISYDPRTLERRPVKKRDVAEVFDALGRHDAVRMIDRLPERDGQLDEPRIDELMVRIHTELQRLHEEFHHGFRVLGLLEPLLASLRAHGERRVRIVDVGCGTGYVVRWLAAHRERLGEVDLVGCDYNAALVAAARQAAAREKLDCRFVVGNAFTLEERGAVFLSMGVVHHFRGDDLTAFFREQSGPETRAFLHYDIARSWLTPIGAWLFHVARMREPIAVHDGILSALRAHGDEALLAAARAGASELSIGLHATARGPFPILRTIRPIIGLRPELVESFRDELGKRARLLEGLS